MRKNSQDGLKTIFVCHKGPDIEVGLGWTLMGFVRIRRKLGITTGHLKLLTVSSAMSRKRLNALLAGHNAFRFDTGGGSGDQHDDPINEGMSVRSSLERIQLEMYDFLNHRPWLRIPLERVNANDTRGRSVSKAQENGIQNKGEKTMRELISGLNAKYPDKPDLVLEWCRIGFRAMFDVIKEVRRLDEKIGKGVASVKEKERREKLNWYNEDKLFDEGHIVSAVKHFYSKDAPAFCQLIDEARATLEVHWQGSKKAVKQAEKNNQIAEVYVPGYGEARMIWVESDYINIGAATRAAWRHKCRRDFQVVVQRSSVGNYQMHCNAIKLENGCRKWLHFGELARGIWRLESLTRGVEIAPGQDWESSGTIIFKDGSISDFYQTGYRTSMLNGSLTAPDVRPTIISHGDLWQVIQDTLPKCDTIIESPDGAKEIVPNPGPEKKEAIKAPPVADLAKIFK